METLLKELQTSMDTFTKEAAKIDNKAAAMRARKASLVMASLLKTYRKESVK